MLREQFVRVGQQFAKNGCFFRVEGHAPRHLRMILIPFPNVELDGSVIPTDHIDLLFPAFSPFGQYAKMALDREMEIPVVFH